jgi:hypothetical protein
MSAYFETREAEIFRERREALLLDVAAIIEAAGSALTPTRFVQVEPGNSPETATRAAAAVAAEPRASPPIPR